MSLSVCHLQFEQHLACEIGKIQDEKRKEVKRVIREREIAEYKHALIVIQVSESEKELIHLITMITTPSPYRHESPLLLS